MSHIAEGTTAGTDVSHNHEGGGAAGKALAQVRAGCFFTNAVQLVFAQELLDVFHLGRGRNTYANPIGLFR